LISILVSIALKNPKMYPIFASILSTIICSFSDKNKKKTIDFVVKKFENKSNSEYLFLWLQRIAIVANYPCVNNTITIILYYVTEIIM
jgi:hypothetical protein